MGAVPESCLREKVDLFFCGAWNRGSRVMFLCVRKSCRPFDESVEVYCYR